MFTQATALEAVMRSIPHSYHVKDIDLDYEKTVRFSWRGDRFQISLESGRVEQVDGDLLCGSNIAILLEALLKAALADIMSKKLANINSKEKRKVK